MGISKRDATGVGTSVASAKTARQSDLVCCSIIAGIDENVNSKLIDVGDCNPPDANRWVTHTLPKQSDIDGPGSGVFLDYLRATLPSDATTWTALAGWLGELAPRPMGWHGFYDKSAKVLDGGIVAWCSESEWAERQGIVVDLPGRACASLGDRLVPFLSWCCAVGKVRRLDVAIDDRAGLVTYERLQDTLSSGGLVSKAKTCRWIIEQDTRTAARLGWTLYIGTRKSAAMVRIYDKAAERLCKGVQVAGSWVRVELEAHKDYADSLARAILAGGPAVGLAQIAEKIRCCEPSATDSNRWRWSLATWWRAFLDGIEPGGSLTCGETQETTIEKTQAWLFKQVAPALAVVDRAHGDDTSWMLALFASGDRRQKPKHHAALALWEGKRNG